jgi:hypothetical protein
MRAVPEADTSRASTSYSDALFYKGASAFPASTYQLHVRTFKLMPAPNALNWSASCIANSLQDTRWHGSRSACIVLGELCKYDDLQSCGYRALLMAVYTHAATAAALTPGLHGLPGRQLNVAARR